MNGIKIKGMGRCVPQRVVTNEDMAKIVDTTDQWITSRTGIRHRRHCVSETGGHPGALRRLRPPAGAGPAQRHPLL